MFCFVVVMLRSCFVGFFVYGGDVLCLSCFGFMFGECVIVFVVVVCVRVYVVWLF